MKGEFRRWLEILTIGRTREKNEQVWDHPWLFRNALAHQVEVEVDEWRAAVARYELPMSAAERRGFGRGCRDTKLVVGKEPLRRADFKLTSLLDFLAA